MGHFRFYWVELTYNGFNYVSLGLNVCFFIIILPRLCMFWFEFLSGFEREMFRIFWNFWTFQFHSIEFIWVELLSQPSSAGIGKFFFCLWCPSRSDGRRWCGRRWPSSNWFRRFDSFIGQRNSSKPSRAEDRADGISLHFHFSFLFFLATKKKRKKETNRQRMKKSTRTEPDLVRESQGSKERRKME